MTNVQVCISISIVLASIFGTFFFVNIHRHEEMFIPGVNPKDVYRVFSNFTNFFILEPNLIRFKLLAILDGEKIINVTEEVKYNEFKAPDRKVALKNSQDWGYIVWYEEFYQYLPSIFTNKNEGKYILSQAVNQEDAFILSSYHSTEFLPGHPISTTCINTFKEVVRNEVTGTLFTESLSYESPILFLAIANAEVEYQRPKVFKALHNWRYN